MRYFIGSFNEISPFSFSTRKKIKSTYNTIAHKDYFFWHGRRSVFEIRNFLL